MPHYTDRYLETCCVLWLLLCTFKMQGSWCMHSVCSENSKEWKLCRSTINLDRIGPTEVEPKTGAGSAGQKKSTECTSYVFTSAKEWKKYLHVSVLLKIVSIFSCDISDRPACCTIRRIDSHTQPWTQNTTLGKSAGKHWEIRLPLTKENDLLFMALQRRFSRSGRITSAIQENDTRDCRWNWYWAVW